MCSAGCTSARCWDALLVRWDVFFQLRFVRKANTRGAESEPRMRVFHAGSAPLQPCTGSRNQPEKISHLGLLKVASVLQVRGC